MGKLSHIFAHMAINSAREARQEEEKNQKRNTIYSMLQDKETELQNYLNSVGCKLTYIFDVNVIDNGNFNSEIRKMEKIKKDVGEYIALGGEIQVLFNFDYLERHIGVLKYLRKIGQVHRHFEFLDDDKYSVEDKIRAEEEALTQQIALFREEHNINTYAKVSEIIGGDINTLSGVAFENVCQQLVENMGFKTETTKASGDGGIDLIAHNFQPLLSGKYIIQCKRYTGSVGEPIIRDLYGVVMSERANKGILMTTGHFTRSAIAFATDKPIELIDGTKLKELLTQYNLQDNITSIESSINSVEAAFDPKAFMGYYYEDYIFDINAAKRDPGDIKSRCAVIEKIVQTIRMRLALFELGDKGTYDINYYDLYKMINMLKEYIQPLIKQDNSKNPNKRLRYIYYTCLLIDAEYSALSGDYGNAVKVFSKALYEWQEIQENDILRLNILNTLFAIFNIVNCPELVDKYCRKFNNFLNEMKTFYGKDSSYQWKQEHNNKMMRLLNDPHSAMTVISFGPEDIYDKCVTQWGDFEIMYGAAEYHIDYDRDRLMRFSCNKWDKKEKDIVVLENLSRYTNLQREHIRRVASQYV